MLIKTCRGATEGPRDVKKGFLEVNYVVDKSYEPVDYELLVPLREGWNSPSLSSANAQSSKLQALLMQHISKGRTLACIIASNHHWFLYINTDSVIYQASKEWMNKTQDHFIKATGIQCFILLQCFNSLTHLLKLTNKRKWHHLSWWHSYSLFEALWNNFILYYENLKYTERYWRNARSTISLHLSFGTSLCHLDDPP